MERSLKVVRAMMRTRQAAERKARKKEAKLAHLSDNQRFVHDLARKTLDEGHEWNQEELDRVREVVRGAGWNPEMRREIGDSISEPVLNETILTRQDRLTDQKAHWLKHVMDDKRWGEPITEAEYHAEIVATLSDPVSGWAVMDYRGQPQITCLGRSRYGDQDNDNLGRWVIVHYRTDLGYWSTAFRPGDEYGGLESMGKKGYRWIRKPGV